MGWMSGQGDEKESGGPLFELVGRELCLWRDVFSPTAPTPPTQS